MLDFLNLIKKTKTFIRTTENINTLETIRVKFLGKKGIFNQKIKIILNCSPEDRFKKFSIVNQAKQEIENLIVQRKNILQSIIINKKIINEKLDISLPGRKPMIGGLHPITSVIDRIIFFFRKMGFSIVYGPEIENSYYNFDSLNISKYHPARNNQDTFWIDANNLLRTQTSGIQIRVMQSNVPPIRIISPGRVYRKDFDKYHTPMFHQIEGLIVDKTINFHILKSIMYKFLYNFFRKQNCIKIRFRTSYFPFTEPSAEIDIMSNKYNWVETLGCGMVHPNVLLNVNIDPKIFSACAFGIGIERLAMLYYNIADLRLFFENDLRFLKQFK